MKQYRSELYMGYCLLLAVLILAGYYFVPEPYVVYLSAFALFPLIYFFLEAMLNGE